MPTWIAFVNWEQAIRVVMLRDHNTRVVVLGTMLLGMAAGVIGTFMLLRKRALVGDALSHAALPGIAMAFIVATHLGADGKSLPILLMGATLSSVAGIGCILLIRRFTRLTEDVALGVVLSVFFGLGVALLGVIQSMRQGNAAGLESFIYGKTASMLVSDAQAIAMAAIAVSIVCAMLFKEFSLLCFDEQFAATQGWPVTRLDVVMMGLVVIVTVIGLQAVGLILMIALLIIPAAAARFWTHHLPWMVVISSVIGGASGLVGACLSALVPRLPAGAIIVTVAAFFFLISLVFGPARGIMVRAIRHIVLEHRIAKQHLLRAIYEQYELDAADSMGELDSAAAGWKALLVSRSWSASQLRRGLSAAARERLVRRVGAETYQLTTRGMAEASRVIRNHRLWEIYLITYADIAPSHVDRDADQIEHVLGPAMVQQLEDVVKAQYPHVMVPPSPHVIAPRRMS